MVKGATEEQKLEASMRWLIDNYGHIWWHPKLSIEQKAGFLAACCDTRRCYLATFSLENRIGLLSRILEDTLS